MAPEERTRPRCSWQRGDVTRETRGTASALYGRLSCPVRQEHVSRVPNGRRPLSGAAVVGNSARRDEGIYHALLEPGLLTARLTHDCFLLGLVQTSGCAEFDTAPTLRGVPGMFHVQHANCAWKEAVLPDSGWWPPREDPSDCLNHGRRLAL